MEEVSPKYNKQLLFLWIICVLGSLATIPYCIETEMIVTKRSLSDLMLSKIVVNSILFGGALWLSSIIIPKTDLSPFSRKRVLYPAFIVGTFLGLVLFFSDHLLFPDICNKSIKGIFITSVLDSLYRAIQDEALMRLFFLSFFYYLLLRFFGGTVGNRKAMLWTATFLSSLVYGSFLVYADFSQGIHSGIHLTRTLFLNGIAGMAYGWLYWSRNFYAAVFAHFITELMMRVL